MPAPRFLRCARVPLLWLAGVAALLAKPITPHGPHGSTIATAPALRNAAETGDLADEPGAPALFTTVPAPLPPNVASVNFEATGTAEFGDLIRLNGVAHFVGGVAVTMSTGALHSEHPDASAFGFTHPITLSLYAVDHGSTTPRPGVLLARVTESFLIPWRPEPDPSAVNLPGRPWRAADGHLYTGRAFTVTFDVGALGLALPDEVVLGVAFNTQHAGAQPLGVPGPYDGLGIAVTDQTAGIGLDANPDVIFWKTTHAAGYADGGAAGLNTLRADSGWAPFRPALRVTDSNYGALYATIAQLDTLRGATPDTRDALTAARGALSDALDRELWDGNQRLDPVYGDYVFEFLGEASDALHTVVARQDPHAAEAQQAIDELLASSSTLADTAVVDALILGGNARNIVRAQRAIDAAGELQARASAGAAIDQLGTAWRQALSALR